MSSAFTKLNDLYKSDDGVYRSKADRDAFNYTDGPQSEQRLRSILQNASDLGSASEELEEHINDWPTEYHLSSSRANLLRCLDLSGVKRVLELGCGCGSISRFIGEHPHIELDAVEGSEARAAIAALRCRDLANVTISVANFNQVEFPQDYYDLVLFVGVTEYAGRFSDRQTDQEALQDLLSLGHKSSTEKGVTLVAIENRTGLKYMLGASEDHYGKPYIGIQDYPEDGGIRTYTKGEWQQQITNTDFACYEFLYPFPDYKIPTMVLHQNAIKSQSIKARAALVALFSDIQSRDYLRPFNLGEQEAMLWQALYAAGTFEDHANSFLILLANDSKQLSKIADFDYQRFPEKHFAARYEPAYSGNKVPTKGKIDNEVVELRNQLNLIKQSRSWRYFSKLRPILQALGLERK